MQDDRRAIRGSKGTELKGRKIALCITASVASMESPRIARELMKHGAEVVAVFSDAASKMLSPDLMEWATGNEVVKEITSKIEHVQLGGRGKEAADLILIAPCTANTLSKIVAGISDSPVTSLVTCAIGSGIPIIIAPGMHEPMYDNPIIKQNILKLRSMGIRFVEPMIEEGKAKIASSELIVNAAIDALSEKSLRGKRFVITAGPTVEYIDPVRVITNRSSGKMGIALAEVALRRGAEVALIYGPGSEPAPAGADVIRVDTTEEMLAASKKELAKRVDVFIAAGAPADFSAAKRSPYKIGSRSKLRIELNPTPKIIDVVKSVSKRTMLVAFKAEYGIGNKTRKNLQELFRNSQADLVVMNDVSRPGVGFDADTNEVTIYDRTLKGKKLGLAPKKEIASQIIDEIMKRITRQ